MKHLPAAIVITLIIFCLAVLPRTTFRPQVYPFSTGNK